MKFLVAYRRSILSGVISLLYWGFPVAQYRLTHGLTDIGLSSFVHGAMNLLYTGTNLVLWVQLVFWLVSWAVLYCLFRLCIR